ncbi:hypothetical protein S83_066935 [Arachis hypogaea]
MTVPSAGTTSWISVSSAKLNQASATSEECTVAWGNVSFMEAVEAKSSSSSGYGSMVSVHGYLEEEKARRYIPREFKLAEAFGNTLGGFFLASYEDSPAGVFDEVLLWLKQWDSAVFGSEIRIAQTQRPFNSKFSRTNRGAKWSSGRYKNSRSMDEGSNSQGIEDILNTRTTNVGPPEQKAQPVNVPTSFKQRAMVVDEIWHAAGDNASDIDWYAKRTVLAGIYSTTEIYMLTDTSPDFHDTMAFLDARVKDAFDLKKTIQELHQTLLGIILRRGYVLVGHKVVRKI